MSACLEIQKTGTVISGNDFYGVGAVGVVVSAGGTAATAGARSVCPLATRASRSAAAACSLQPFFGQEIMGKPPMRSPFDAYPLEPNRFLVPRLHDGLNVSHERC